MPCSKTRSSARKPSAASCANTASGSGCASKPSTRPRLASPSVNGTSRWATNPNLVMCSPRTPTASAFVACATNFACMKRSWREAWRGHKGFLCRSRLSNRFQYQRLDGLFAEHKLLHLAAGSHGVGRDDLDIARNLLAADLALTECA